MEILHDLVELLTVDDEADVHEGCTLRDHIYICPLERCECPLEHAVKTDDVLSDDRHLSLVLIHDDLSKLRKFRHHIVDLLRSIHSHGNVCLRCTDEVHGHLVLAEDLEHSAEES